MCVGLTLPSKSEGGGSKSIKLTKSPTLELTPTHTETAAHKDIGIKEVKGRERTQQPVQVCSTTESPYATHTPHTHTHTPHTQKSSAVTPRTQTPKGGGGPIRSSARKRTRPSPYVAQKTKMEVSKLLYTDSRSYNNGTRQFIKSPSQLFVCSDLATM